MSKGFICKNSLQPEDDPTKKQKVIRSHDGQPDRVYKREEQSKLDPK